MDIPSIRLDPSMPTMYFVQQFLVGTLGYEEYLLDYDELSKVRSVFKAFSDMCYGTRYLDFSKCDSR